MVQNIDTLSEEDKVEFILKEATYLAKALVKEQNYICLLYTSDAADE